jgi:hypothetical protein
MRREESCYFCNAHNRTLDEIKGAFEAAGIHFLPENGGGVGLRLTDAVPRLARTRISRFEEVATLIVRYHNCEYRVSVSTHTLDDLDAADHKTDQDFERSLAQNMNRILAQTARAIDAGRGAIPARSFSLPRTS